MNREKGCSHRRCISWDGTTSRVSGAAKAAVRDRESISIGCRSTVCTTVMRDPSVAMQVVVVCLRGPSATRGQMETNERDSECALRHLPNMVATPCGSRSGAVQCWLPARRGCQCPSALGLWFGLVRVARDNLFTKQRELVRCYGDRGGIFEHGR